MRRTTAALLAVVLLAGAGALGLGGWVAVQAATSASAAPAQQRAATRVEAAWPTPSAVPRVAPEPKDDGAVIATIRVPRFGARWVRTIRQGVGEEVLDSASAGVGHYPGTAMPGGVGNVALAGHDTGWGDAFRRLGSLRVGDKIRIRTAVGEFVYAFRNFRWVPATAVDVLLPVPERPHATIGGRLLTLTTCDPPYHAEERFVAYAELVATPPASRGLARLKAALRRATPADAVRAVRRAGIRGPIEVTQRRTSVGRPVPAVQIGARSGRVCLVGQTGGAVRTVQPVAGRCLIGDTQSSP